MKGEGRESKMKKAGRARNEGMTVNGENEKAEGSKLITDKINEGKTRKTGNWEMRKYKWQLENNRKVGEYREEGKEAEEKEIDSEQVQAKTERKGGGEQETGREIDKESERVGDGGREGCRSHLLSGN